MNLANTIKAMYEKRSDPPFDVSKADYAGAAKELTQYAKTKGGIDKNDFLAFANRMSAIANKKAPRVTAKFARDLMDLDTSPREKIVSVMRSNGIKVTVQGGGFKIEDFTLEELEELDELEEAKVMGREVHDKTFANRTQADNFAKKNGGRVRQVGRVFYVFKEGDEKENDDEEKCPECGEYPCQCDDVKTSESSCGSKRKMNEDFDALFEEAIAIEEAYKTPAEAKAYEDGKKAVAKKVSYDDNPNKKGTKEYTAWSKGHNDARAKLIAKRHVKEDVELDENAGLIKDYQGMKAQGKKDSNILDVLMSMPKYKRMSKDQMAKIIGDAKRKGIFKEEVELQESPMVTYTVSNVTSDMASKLERLAKENGVEYSRKGRTVVLKGKRSDVTSIRTKMGIAQTNIPMVPVKEEVELEEKFKVGDKVKVKKGTLKSPDQRHYETKAGTIVKDYKDGEFKINFGGNDDFSIDGKFLVKEDVDEARDPSKSGGTGYDLYHKDFSSAMKHAYDYAKKKFGIEIDPKEIDDKVASGPRKPSAGKTNSYRLKSKDGKKGVQIQVANLDNKKYELNMYKEEVELEETTMKLDEAREDTATQVARALKKMGVKPNAKEADIIKKIPGVLKKMGLENDKLIKRDPDFIGDVLDSMNEDIDIQEEQKISLEESIMRVVFGEAKKAPVTKKDDDGDGMDPVGQEDGDVDNDGDKDDSDEYLKNRRKAVGKAVKKDKKDAEGASTGKQDPVDTKPALDEKKLDELSPELKQRAFDKRNDQHAKDQDDYDRAKSKAGAFDKYDKKSKLSKASDKLDKSKMYKKHDLYKRSLGHDADLDKRGQVRGSDKSTGQRFQDYKDKGGKLSYNQYKSRYMKNSFDPAEVERIMESFEPTRFAQYGDRAEQVMELTAIKMAEKKHK